MNIQSQSLALAERTWTMDFLNAHTVSRVWMCQLFQDIIGYTLSTYDDFFVRVLPQEETWVHHEDPDNDVRPMQWKHEKVYFSKRELCPAEC